MTVYHSEACTRHLRLLLCLGLLLGSLSQLFSILMLKLLLALLLGIGLCLLLSPNLLLPLRLRLRVPLLWCCA